MVVDSATSTSPLGATYSQRELSKRPAYLGTAKPAGAVGILPAGHLVTWLRRVADSVAYGAGRPSRGRSQKDFINMEAER